MIVDIINVSYRYRLRSLRVWKHNKIVEDAAAEHGFNLILSRCAKRKLKYVLCCI